MLTLLTTANFPDVMLPAYYKNWLVCFFFGIYTLLGLYFLLNLLLASVFITYKKRYQARITENSEKRRKQVLEIYDKFDAR